MKPQKQAHSLSHSRCRGFSLIELLIVVIILLVLAALAIPNLLRSRMRANEAAAVAAMRSIATAQVSYQTTYDRGFAPGLPALGPPPTGTPRNASAADLIDSLLANGTRGGYIFTYNPIDADGDSVVENYTVNANPARPGSSGEKYFFVDQTNIIRENIGSPANASSPPVPK